MTKGNVRDVLLQVCDQFHKLTGEFVGVTHTWIGGLNILGPNSFRELVEANKEELWRSLAFPEKMDTTLTKPFKDKEMLELLGQEISKHNQNTLRKIIACATHNSTDKLGSSYVHFRNEITIIVK